MLDPTEFVESLEQLHGKLDKLLELHGKVDRLLQAAEHPMGIDPAARYSTREVSDLLGLKYSTIYDHVRNGSLVCMPTGTRKKMFRGADVLAFVHKRNPQGGSSPSIT